METSETVKEIRSRTGLNRKEFCQKFGIPLRTMEEWETGRRIPPEYIPIHKRVPFLPVPGNFRSDLTYIVPL